MNKEEYKKIVKKHTPKEKRLQNAIIAFVSGGLFGVLAQGLGDLLKHCFALNNVDTIAWMLIIVIFLSCLLTALGVFDKLVTIFKSALIIPISGFAHSACSSSLDYKKDGFVTGIGSNCFKLAGSVILFGIVSAFFLVLLGVIIYG